MQPWWILIVQTRRALDCVRDSSTSLSSDSDYESTLEPSNSHNLHCDSLNLFRPICASRLRHGEEEPTGHRKMGLCGSRPVGCVGGRLVPAGKRNRRRRRRSIKRRTSSLKLDSSSVHNRPQSTPTCAGSYMHFPFCLLFSFLCLYLYFSDLEFFWWLAIRFGACSSAVRHISATLSDDNNNFVSGESNWFVFPLFDLGRGSVDAAWFDSTSVLDSEFDDEFYSFRDGRSL